MLIASFLFLTVICLWVVGARNRLIRLHQAIARSFTPLELQLRKRHALARHLGEAALHGNWVPREVAESVLACIGQAAAALQGVKGPATHAELMRRVAVTEEVLAAALPPLMAATAVPADADAAEHLGDLRNRLAQIHAPLDYARLAYNTTVQVYNAALRVFPTTLVAATFRFQPGVQMPRLSSPPAA